jgi:Family of unknown function (DUF6071)
MYMYVNGCSMTYGSELQDDPNTKVCLNHSYRWHYSWPGRLRRMLSAAGVYNDAVPSGSNDRIVRTTIRFVGRWLDMGMPPRGLAVVVGWSHPGRREFFVDHEFRQVVPSHSYDIRSLNRLVKVYRKAAADEREQSWRFLTQVTALSSFLHHQNISFLFFNSLVAPMMPADTLTPVTADALTENWLGGGQEPELTMVEYLKKSPDCWHVQHPNESGHLTWAARLHEEMATYRLEKVDAAALAENGLGIVEGTRVLTRHDRKKSDSRHIVPWRRRSYGLSDLTNGADPFIYS